MDVAVWNVLHDGRNLAIEGRVPGNLRLTVDIPYLCGHLPTQAEYLIVTLSGCERFEYRPYEGCSVTEPVDVAALELGLLSAWEADGCMRVACSDGGAGGELVLRYLSAQCVTAEGQPLTQTELESAAELYWLLWKQKHE